MNEQQFWDLIQHAHDQSNGDMGIKCEIIMQAIRHLDKGEAVAFSGYFDEMMDKAYSWDLWGAAYVINGGCSDDSFCDFRASLISRGKRTFSLAIANPDALANENYDEDQWYHEGFQYAVTEGVEARVGATPKRIRPHPDTPSGNDWEEDADVLKARYPQLWARFEHLWAPSKPTPEQDVKPWWKFW